MRERALARGKILSAEIFLTTNVKASLKEDGGGKVGVFNVEGDQGAAFRVGEEWVGEVDVCLGLEKGFQEVGELFGRVAEGHDKELAHGVRNAFFKEDFARALGVARDNAQDRKVEGVLGREAESFDMGGLEELEEGAQCTGAVVKHDRKLLNEILGEERFCFSVGMHV